MNKKAIDHCRFSNWYPRFKSITLTSIIIDLSPDIVDYLLADGIVLPLNRDGTQDDFYTVDRDDESDWGPTENSNDSNEKETEMNKMDNCEQVKEEIDDDDDDDEDSDSEVMEPPFFPELEEKVAHAIEELGGLVFPKLNWSSPKDAVWMSLDGTLKCRTLNDVLLLLKSSDFIVHDLTCAYEDCRPEDEKEEEQEQTSLKSSSTFELVLRKWYDLSPSMEFRCFVRNNDVIGISQRDINNYYEFLHEIRHKIERKIHRFFADNIQSKFFDEDYTFDIYINKSNFKVWLIDFNPFYWKTDSLLFDWEELCEISSIDQGNLLGSNSSETPSSSSSSNNKNNNIHRNTTHETIMTQFRLIQNPEEAAYRSKQQPAYATNRLPKDVFDFSQDLKKMTEFSQLLQSNGIV